MTIPKQSTRREVNRAIKNAAIGLALAPWGWGAGKLGAQTTESLTTRRTWREQPFRLGVASGVPRHDSVVLWTKLSVGDNDLKESQRSGEPLRVEWEVYADEQLQQLHQKGSTVTDQERGHSVRVLLQGLQPNTTYWYRFISGDVTSPVGKTKTAPLPTDNVATLRFALASCQHYEAGQYTAYKDIANQDLDFVLFVGDYIYETNLSAQLAVRKHVGVLTTTLEQYRARYEQYKSDPLLQAAHAAHPWILMWDDHEVVNDYANDLDPAYTDPALFLQRRAAAYRAYFEHQPLWLGPDPKSPHQASMQLNDSFQWGQLAQLWTLDCRQFRSHHACSKPSNGGGRLVLSCDELADESRTMLGFEKEVSLEKDLINATSQWKLLAQGTQISSTRIQTPVGVATYTEAWDGYAPARERLLKSIQRNNIANVVTLGGDVHMNVAANLRPEAKSGSQAVVASEFVTTSITSRGLSDSAVALIKSNNPDILHMRADERGYALFSVDPTRVCCEFRTTPTPAGEQDRLTIQSIYYVDTDQPGPKKLV